MLMIEKLAQLTRKELQESAGADKKYTKHFRRMTSRPQSALGSQRAQVTLGALGGGTLGATLAGKRYKIPAAILSAIGGALATGAAGMKHVVSKKKAAKEFPYEDWSKVKTKD